MISATPATADDIIQTMLFWCQTQWGESVRQKDAQCGNFGSNPNWYWSGSRFWFGADEQFFAFKLRWHGAEIGA